MGLNQYLESLPLGSRAVIGAVLVGIVTFALRIQGGFVPAVVAALIVGPVVGSAYYLGLRASDAYRNQP